MKWTPFPDQTQAIDFALGREAAGIFAKPGSGKTTISLEVLATLRKRGEGRSALIIAPLRPLYSTWPAEVQKWGFPFSVGILHGPKKEKVLAEMHNIYLLNPEGVKWLSTQALPKHIDTLIIDESSKFKAYNAQRFRLMQKMIRMFSNRYILNGTPQTKNLEDLWAQVYLLDGGRRLGPTITAFRRSYMVDTAPPMASYQDWQPMPGAAEEVYDKIKDLCIVIEKRWTSKPRMNNILVPLPAAARKWYDEMENQLFTQLDSGVLTAANAGVKSIKLRQMTGGFVYSDLGGVLYVHQEKIEATLDFIEEMNGEPLLIGVNFDHEAQALRKVLGGDVPYFGGTGLKGAAAAAAIDRWNERKLPVLMANVQSAAHGLNLQHGGSSILYYSLTYNWGDYTQFNARVDREGQKNEVTISHLISPGTVDELVLSVLNGREGNDAAFFNHLKEYRNVRRKAGKKAA